MRSARRARAARGYRPGGLLALWLLGVGLLPLLVAGCQGKLVGRAEELRLGEEAARVIERRYPVSEDEDAQWLVERIGQQIAARSNRPDIDFTFRVLAVKEINALSVPGYVYVNQGLIEACNAAPDELAAVIAHEVAHTTERHLARRMERIYGASFLLTLVASGRSTTDTLAEAAVELVLQGNSRQEERAADAQGARFMARAGYDPRAMIRFFERLQAATGDVRGLNRYFATHPSTADRIARVRALINKEKLAPAAPPSPPEASGK
jgi:predicted Zn-dependent protease